MRDRTVISPVAQGVEAQKNGRVLMIDGKMTRRAFIGTAAMATLTACGGGASSAASTASTSSADSTTGASSAAASGDVLVTMVTDTGGVNDQSFNQLSWAGLNQLKTENGWEINYYESKQDADFATNLDKAIDDGSAIVWAIGFAMSDAVNESAETNPDVLFGSIEGTNTSGAKNLVAVQFKSEEPSFAVGYIAARMSKTGKVGFIGGMTGETIAAFEFGYKAGIAYANAEQGTKVECQSQYAESFGDAAKGNSIAQKMIKDGCDVLFHAAAATGVGMLEACNDAGVWSIGVDADQAALFPEYTTIITSALKRTDNAIVKVSNGLMDGSVAGGDNIVLGASDDAVGLAETHDRLPDDIYNATLEVFDKIKAGSIVAPSNQADYEAYIKTL